MPKRETQLWIYFSIIFHIEHIQNTASLYRNLTNWACRHNDISKRRLKSKCIRPFHRWFQDWQFSSAGSRCPFPASGSESPTPLLSPLSPSSLQALYLHKKEKKQNFNPVMVIVEVHISCDKGQTEKKTSPKLNAMINNLYILNNTSLT